MINFQSLAMISTAIFLAACSAVPTSAPTNTLVPSATTTQTLTPSQTATFAPTATRYPTATFSPPIATAAAKGECITSFDSFAYAGPPVREVPRILQPPPWRIAATIPPHGLSEYSDNLWLIGAKATRRIGGHQEVWLSGTLYSNDGSFKYKLMFYVYQPETGQWEIIPGDIEDTHLSIRDLFVLKDGSLWGSIVESEMGDRQAKNSVPILSKFNESTRRFELTKGAMEITLGVGEQYFSWPRIELDEHDIFWVFTDNDGIYRYDPIAQTTDKQADLPDTEITYTSLSPDGSIYFAKHSDRMYSGETFLRTVPGTLFQFVPETGEIVSIELPDEAWPAYAGLFTDHTGNLWLGAIGYRDPDGEWHLTHPYIDRYFQLVDGGGYSYVWATPWLMLESSDGILWYQKSLDTSGLVDGVAWYDPDTGEGCQITNIPADIVEDADRRLWLAADGKLYQYPLD